MTRLASIGKIRGTRPPLGTEVVIPYPIQRRGRTVIRVSTPVLTMLAASVCPRVGSLLQNINSLCLLPVSDHGLSFMREWEYTPLLVHSKYHMCGLRACRGCTGYEQVKSFVRGIEQCPVQQAQVRNSSYISSSGCDAESPGTTSQECLPNFHDREADCPQQQLSWA